MANSKTVQVPHLGGITAGYQMPHPYDSSKPTLVLVNSFTTSSELYRGQSANKTLTDAMNLLAIELLGHGKTRTKSENFTYWDTAIMNLQVMDALDVKRAFVLGTSQGGWITVRMALLVPDRVKRLALALALAWPGQAIEAPLLTINSNPKPLTHRSKASFPSAPPSITSPFAPVPSALLGLPEPTHTHRQHLDQQHPRPQLRARRRLLQLSGRYRLRQRLRKEREGVLDQGN
jgi:pimeloyl-ACP methyl ester carboxylesterase